MNGDGSGAKDGADNDSSEIGAKSKKTKTHLSKKEKKELDRLESEEIARAEQRVLVRQTPLTHSWLLHINNDFCI